MSTSEERLRTLLHNDRKKSKHYETETNLCYNNNNCNILPVYCISDINRLNVLNLQNNNKYRYEYNIPIVTVNGNIESCGIRGCNINHTNHMCNFCNSTNSNHLEENCPNKRNNNNSNIYLNIFYR